MSVRIERLRAGYGGNEVLRGIDLVFRAGEVAGVIGPNGAGKSTLLKAVAGLIRFDGVVERGAAPAGYLPQDASARAALTVFETVLLGRVGALGLRVPPAELEAAARTLELVGIEALADRGLGELSGGERQMTLLAQVLAGNPRVLLLDEPTSSLDLRNGIEMLRLVRRLTAAHGLVTVLAIHDLNAAVRFADRLVLLHQGRVEAEGAPDDVLRPALLEMAYGIPVLVGPGPDARLTILPCG